MPPTFLGPDENGYYRSLSCCDVCKQARTYCVGGIGPDGPPCEKCVKRGIRCEWSFRCTVSPKLKDPNAPKQIRLNGRKVQPTESSSTSSITKPNEGDNNNNKKGKKTKTKKDQQPPGFNKYKSRPFKEEEEEEEEEEEAFDSDVESEAEPSGSSELSAPPSDSERMVRKAMTRDGQDFDPRASGSGSGSGSKREKSTVNGKEREVVKKGVKKDGKKSDKNLIPDWSEKTSSMQAHRVKHKSVQSAQQHSTPTSKRSQFNETSQSKKNSSTLKKSSAHTTTTTTTTTTKTTKNTASSSSHRPESSDKWKRQVDSLDDNPSISTPTNVSLSISQIGVSKRKNVVQSDSEEDEQDQQDQDEKVVIVQREKKIIKGIVGPESRGKEDQVGKTKINVRDVNSSTTTTTTKKNAIEEKPKAHLKLKLIAGKTEEELKNRDISNDATKDTQRGRPVKLEPQQDERDGDRDPKRPKLNERKTSGDQGVCYVDIQRRSGSREEQIEEEERDLSQKTNKDDTPSQSKIKKKRGKSFQDDDEPDPTVIIQGKRNRKSTQESHFAYSDETDSEDESTRRESKAGKNKNKNTRQRDASSLDSASAHDDQVGGQPDDATGDQPKNKKQKSGVPPPPKESDTVVHKQVAALRKRGETQDGSDLSSTSKEEKVKGETTIDISASSAGKVKERRLSDVASGGGTTSAAPTRRPHVQEKKPLVGSAPKKQSAVKPFDPFADTLMRMSGVVSGSTTPNKDRDGKSKNGINFRGAEKAEANRKRDELYATNPAINLMLSHNAISRFEHETSQKGSAMALYGVQQGAACANGVRVSQSINIFEGLLRLRDKEDWPKAI